MKDFFKSRFEFMWDRDKGRRIPPFLVHLGHMGQVFIPSIVLFQIWNSLVGYSAILTLVVTFVILGLIIWKTEWKSLRSSNPAQREDSFWDSYQMLMGAVLAGLPPLLNWAIFIPLFVGYFVFLPRMKG